MAFVLTEQRSFKATVPIKIPKGLDDFENQAIVCEYKIIEDSVMEATVKAGGDKAVFKTILKSVEGFTDESGEPMYLDEDLIKAICDRVYLLRPIIRTYYSRLNGDEPALKNV